MAKNSLPAGFGYKEVVIVPSGGVSLPVCVAEKHPELECIDSRVASPASRLSVSRHLRRLLRSSAGCCFCSRFKVQTYLGARGSQLG